VILYAITFDMRTDNLNFIILTSLEESGLNVSRNFVKPNNYFLHLSARSSVKSFEISIPRLSVFPELHQQHRKDEEQGTKETDILTIHTIHVVGAKGVDLADLIRLTPQACIRDCGCGGGVLSLTSLYMTKMISDKLRV